ALHLHTVTDDPAPTVLADRCEPVDGALERVERVHPATLGVDLESHLVLIAADLAHGHAAGHLRHRTRTCGGGIPEQRAGKTPTPPASPRPVGMRSEEHTSELESRENLVCRLLLEKK